MDGHHLPILLRQTSRLILLAEVARVVLLTAGVLLGAGLLAVVIDGALALQPWALIAVDVLVVALAAAGLVWTLRQVLANLYEPRRTARLIEQRLGIGDSRLINAVEFATSRGSGSAELLRRSVRDGEELAAGIPSTAAVRARRTWKAAGVVGFAILFVLAAYVSAPRLFAAVVPRYLDPHGDHPPYTLVEFDIETAPEPVLHGRAATVMARLSGPAAVDRADVVFFTDEGTQRLPMFRSADGTFTLPIDRAESTRDFFIDTPEGRSPRHTLTVLEVPTFEDVRVAYQFPEYTAWPQAGHPLDARGVRALAGTRVTITAGSNLSLREGRVELVFDDHRPARTVKLKPTKADVAAASGSFVLEADGRYSLSLLAANGAESLEPLAGSLTAVPDRPPQVAIATPEPQLVAVEGYKVPVLIQAADDVGIARLVLFCGVNGWGPQPTELDVEQSEPTLARGLYEFDLGALGARSGDLISYYASAYDNRPPDGQFTNTPTHVIQVISEEEYLEFARTQYRMEEIVREVEDFRRQLDERAAERQELLKQLDELEKKLAGDEPLNEDELQELERLREQLQGHEEQLEQLAKQMQQRAEQPQLYDLEQPYQEMLKELGEQLEQQAENAQNAADALQRLQQQPDDPQARQAAQEAAEHLEKENQPFDEETGETLDQTAEQMELFRKADRMLEQAERIRAVVEQQRELADRMGQFRDQEQLAADDRRRAEQMAKEQELLRQELDEAREKLEQTAKECQGDLPKTTGDAQKLCEAIGEMQIPGDQGEAARQARAGDGKQSHASAESAAQKLESLQCESCTPKGAGGEMDADRGLSLPKPGAASSLQQLAQGRTIPGLKGRSGQQGGGFQGSQARTVVLGPHLPTGDAANPRPGRMGGEGRGRPGTDGEMFGGRAAESLTPLARDGDHSAAGNLRGVPVPYREQAEAYFRRLAEEK